MRRFLRQAAGYTVASGLALIVDVSLLVALVEWLGWHYLAAATVSFLVGAVVAYAIVVRFVFDYRRVNDRRAEFFIFAAVGLMGLVINVGTIHVLVEHFALTYLLAKAAAAGFTFCANFVARRWLLFTRWPPARDSVAPLSGAGHD